MTIRHKRDRVIVSGNVSRSSSRRLAAVSRSSHTAHVPADVTRAAISYGSTLAAVYATPAGEDVTKAKRARRNARHRLVQLVGTDAATRFASALEFDGGLFLRALSHAPATMRDHCLAAALNGAQTALEHGVSGRAALVMLTRSTLWQALSSAYQHESIRMGGDDAFDKRAALCGQQARLDLLGALELAKSDMLAPVMEREVDTAALYAAALSAAEKQSIEAGIISNDDNDLPEGGLSPLSDDENG
jgi:hypothetical protein